jgi:hypothetical protein
MVSKKREAIGQQNGGKSAGPQKAKKRIHRLPHLRYAHMLQLDSLSLTIKYSHTKGDSMVRSIQVARTAARPMQNLDHSPFCL